MHSSMRNSHLRAYCKFCMPKLFSGVTLVSPTSRLSYKVGDVVGRGSFGVVYMAQANTSSEQVALKVIDMFTSRQPISNILDEIEVMKIAHERSGGRCPKLHEAFRVSVGPNQGSPRTYVVIVMEYITGINALDLMSRQGSPFCETFAAYVLLEVSLALVGLHGARLVHRDIKSSNIMLSSTGAVYLCDFGVSKVLSKAVLCTTTLSGTPFWMAPEILLGSSYGLAADVFSLGITAVELVIGHPPLPPVGKENGEVNILEKAKQVTFESMIGSLDPAHISRSYRNIVGECLAFDPCYRVSVNELKEKLVQYMGTGYNPRNVLGKLVSKYLYPMIGKWVMLV